MSIYIFTRPIHSGKTTALMHWCDKQENIAGVLMPDICGSRKILNLATKEIFDIECFAGNTNEAITTVGKFRFYTKAFEKANDIIINAINQNPHWLVIDEAGKLELEGNGFYGSIVQAVACYNNRRDTGNLLITVRDSLCEVVISFFGIQHCRIIHDLTLIGE